MTHDEKRLFLLERLMKEGGYRMAVPEGEDNQWQLLRALMNVRPPMAIDDDFLKVQDEYLREMTARKGIVDVDSLTPVKDGLYLWKGDITTLRVDAIVNAANSGMTGCYQPNHGCIDNIIHTMAGVQLRLICSEIMQAQQRPEPVGRAKLTPAFNLPSDYVIHTVGPVCEDGEVTPKIARELENCYRSCMLVAGMNQVRSIAFCCISTGVFGFPQRRAAEIAFNTVKDCLRQPTSVEKVVFNVFKDEDEAIYAELLGQA